MFKHTLILKFESEIKKVIPIYIPFPPEPWKQAILAIIIFVAIYLPDLLPLVLLIFGPFLPL